MATKRLDYIDTTKFLAIFFILIGHCDIKSGISQFLYAFHVQLFFIVYGFCHKQKSYNNLEIWGRCKKLSNRLVLPYFLLVFILGYGLSIKNFFLAAYGTGWSLYNPDTVHLWFLPCFFLSAVIFEIIRAKINVNTDMGGAKWISVTLVIAIMIGFGAFSAFFDFDRDCMIKLGSNQIHLTGFTKAPSSNEYYIGFPFSLNVALSGVIFMFIGSMLRKLVEIVSFSERKGMAFVTFVICGALGFFTFILNQHNITPKFELPVVSMGAAVYGKYLLFLITSVLLSIATIGLAVLINNKLFSRIGKHTMEIYAFHCMFVGFIIYHIREFNIPEFGGITAAVVILIVCSLLIPIIDWAIPSLKG